MSEEHKKEIDQISGVETTGHEWDGLKELNNPAPRWWLIVFVITVIWSIGYWVVFPAWPTISGATKGIDGWTSHKKLQAEQAEILTRQKAYNERFEHASLQEIMKDPELYEFAMSGGKAAFKDNCATCHGTGGAGGRGYPNLNDDDWLWGGTIDAIHFTITNGIRSASPETRMSEMPSFGKTGMLQTSDINAVVDYVLTLSSKQKPKSTHEQGMKIFQENCAACHGADGKGGREVGAPNLSDKIWLYGSDHESLFATVYNGRKGVMPSWKGRLDDNTIKQLSLYVHELGGGEADAPVQTIIADQPENGVTTGGK